MSLPDGTAAPRPWYREFWPWLLMLPPALSVLGGGAMIFLAVTTPSALVVEDYARIEELTEERFGRDREAARLGLSALLTVTAESGLVEVVLTGPEAFTPPPELILNLRHATSAAADRVVALQRAGDVFRAEVDFTPGLYRIELEPALRSWRLGTAAVRLPGQIAVAPPDLGG